MDDVRRREQPRQADGHLDDVPRLHGQLAGRRRRPADEQARVRK